MSGIVLLTLWATTSFFLIMYVLFHLWHHDKEITHIYKAINESIDRENKINKILREKISEQ